MTLAPWLRRQLIASGRMTAEGLTRRAKIMTHRCGCPCFAGYDGDICAMDAWAELQEVNVIGEAEALMSGRRTYTYWIRLEHLQLRNQFDIQWEPAGSQEHRRVLVEHRCDEPFPAHWAHPRDLNAPPEIEESDECPF